jgi:hypothetical protein
VPDLRSEFPILERVAFLNAGTQGPAPRAGTAAAAAAAELTHRVEAIPSLTLDVDTPEDLGLLSEALDERRGQACMTRGTLRQLDRSNARRSVARHEAPGHAVQVQA